MKKIELGSPWLKILLVFAARSMVLPAPGPPEKAASNRCLTCDHRCVRHGAGPLPGEAQHAIAGGSHGSAVIRIILSCSGSDLIIGNGNQTSDSPKWAKPAPVRFQVGGSRSPQASRRGFMGIAPKPRSFQPVPTSVTRRCGQSKPDRSCLELRQRMRSATVPAARPFDGGEYGAKDLGW